MIRQTLYVFGGVLLSVSGLMARSVRIKASEHNIKPNQIEQIGTSLNKLIKEQSEGLTSKDTLVITLDPGKYYFSDKGSPHKEVYISNHDQLKDRAIGLLIEGKTNLVIEGNQSEFVYRDRMLPIAIIDSRNVSVKGISIDFVDPPISQISIVENKGKEGITFRPAPWVRWRINSEGVFETYGSNWKSTPWSGIVFMGDTYHTAYRISDLSYSTKGVEQIGRNELLAPKWQDERLKPGMVVTMRDYYRPNPAVFIDNSTDTRIEGVNIYYADGMGLLAQNSHNVTLRGFNVARRGNTYEYQESKEQVYFTTQADATHFSGCSGHIKVSHSLFEHMMDDAINVHGVYLKLTKRIDDYTVEGQYMHEQAWGFEWGRVGDPVQFVYSKTFDSMKGYRKIKAISPVDKPTTLGAKVFRIQFDKKLPADIRPETSIGLENMRKIASVEFTHNIIRNNRARGTLINTPLPVDMSYNLFDHISGAAIVASTDCNQWFESGQTQRFHIHHNTFRDVLTSLYQFTDAVISLHPVIPELGEQKVPFYGDGKAGILIEDNTFETFDTPLVYGLSVKGLLWRRNKVVETKTYEKYHPNQERFKFKGSTNIKIEE